jgi:hypothetical protein
MCYKKCSLLAGETHSNRVGEYTCRKTVKCEEDEEEHGGKCYKKCSLLSGGTHPIRHDDKTCKKAAKCADNEEEFSGKCYKKCSLLTGGARPHRWDSHTCSPYPDQFEDRCAQQDCGSGQVHTRLIWDTRDDLDIYVQAPGKSQPIYYGRTRYAGGWLDVDANAGWRYTDEPIENVFFPAPGQPDPAKGVYKMWMKLYRARDNNKDTTWSARIKIGDTEKIYSGVITKSQKANCRRTNCLSFDLGDATHNNYQGPGGVEHDPQSSGTGCSGFGVAGDLTCAKPFYHMWKNHNQNYGECNGFKIASDGGCPMPFYHPKTSGSNCDGYGVAADGGCANLPFDPWTKGAGCAGFGRAGDLTCPKKYYHPWSNCNKFGRAKNGGLAHLPGIADKTINTNAKLPNFHAAVGYTASLNPTTLKLDGIDLDDYQAQ